MRRGLPTGSGRPAQEPPFAVETAREYARIKIDGLRRGDGVWGASPPPCIVGKLPGSEISGVNYRQLPGNYPVMEITSVLINHRNRTP